MDPDIHLVHDGVAPAVAGLAGWHEGLVRTLLGGEDQRMVDPDDGEPAEDAEARQLVHGSNGVRQLRYREGLLPLLGVRRLCWVA